MHTKRFSSSSRKEIPQWPCRPSLAVLTFSLFFFCEGAHFLSAFHTRHPSSQAQASQQHSPSSKQLYPAAATSQLQKKKTLADHSTVEQPQSPTGGSRIPTDPPAREYISQTDRGQSTERVKPRRPGPGPHGRTHLNLPSRAHVASGTGPVSQFPRGSRDGPLTGRAGPPVPTPAQKTRRPHHPAALGSVYLLQSVLFSETDARGTTKPLSRADHLRVTFPRPSTVSIRPPAEIQNYASNRTN